MVSHRHRSDIQKLKEKGCITSKRVEDVMLEVDFNRFYTTKELPPIVLENLISHLYEGQFVFCFNPKVAYPVVCIALMTGDRGKVIAMYLNKQEYERSLKEIQNDQPALLRGERIKLLLYDKTQTYPPYGPYDIIWIDGRLFYVPNHLLTQLKSLGKILYYFTNENNKLQGKITVKNGKNKILDGNQGDIQVMNGYLDSLNNKNQVENEVSSNSSLLDCPVCLERMEPPTKTCINGHAVCCNCSKHLSYCGICREKMSNNRNVTLDQMLEGMTFDCKGQIKGCIIVSPLEELREHEKICQYLITLQCHTCKTKISALEYCNHIRAEHRLEYEPMFPAKTEIEVKSWKNSIEVSYIEIGISGATFECFYKIENDFLYPCVKYLGPECQTNKYLVKVSYIFDGYKLESLKETTPNCYNVVDEVSGMPALKKSVYDELMINTCRIMFSVYVLLN